MALKAVKPTGTISEGTPVAPTQAPMVAPQVAPSVPAPVNSAPPANVAVNSAAALNAGIIENIENIDSIGNFVTIDGESFLYKKANKTVRELPVIVTYGKRFYQWFDEENVKYHDSDTKLDDRYRLKFTIKWQEEREDGETDEMTMSLPTTSAIGFIEYVKKVANAGKAINQVITRMTISRQVNEKSPKKERYSRVEFEAFSLDGQQKICGTI